MALVILTIGFRLPVLLNAGDLNSDGALVGLQGLHLLRGEWAWSLWGTQYQGTLDSLLSGIVMTMSRVTPLAVLFVPLSGAIAMVLVSYLALSRWIPNASAFVAVLPLVLASMAINSPMIYVMRQTMAVLLLVGLLVSLESLSRRRVWLLVPAFSLLGIAFWVDRFALVVIVPTVSLAILLTAWSLRQKSTHRMLWHAVFLCLGMVLALVFNAKRNELFSEFSFALLARNWPLFQASCFPFAIGAKAYFSDASQTTLQWTPSGIMAVLLPLAPWSLLAGLTMSIVGFFRSPPAVRLAALFAVSIAVTALAAFLFGPYPVDVWSVRYLAPAVWFLPFALAPAFAAFQLRTVAVVLSIYAVSLAASGWRSYGRYLNEWRPVVTERGSATQERKLLSFLQARGVAAASAQYWLAYRLTLIFGEKMIVVPLNASEDRYAPYRAQFEASPKKAMLFHVSEPRATVGPYAQMLRQSGVQFEQLQYEGFELLIW